MGVAISCVQGFLPGADKRLRERDKPGESDIGPSSRLKCSEPQSKRIGGATPLVCRYVKPRLEEIDVVIDIIESYIGVARHWRIPAACSSMSYANSKKVPYWLKRVVAIEPVDLDSLHKHKYFTDALVVAAREGSLPMAQWLVEVYLPSGRIRQAIEEAARWGRLDILQWLYEHHTERVAWYYNELQTAVKYGYSQVVEWLLQNLYSETLGKEVLAPLIPLAEITKAMTWLSKLSVCCSHTHFPDLMIRAAERGNLQELQNLYARNRCRVPSHCLTTAIKCGHLEVAQWLRTTEAWQIARSNEIMGAIRAKAHFGSWEIIKWTLENWIFDKDTEDRCYSRLVGDAAAKGDLEIVKYLYGRWTCPRSTGGMYHAALHGHLEVVKWVSGTKMKGGCAMDGAARIGRLDIIEWVQQQHPKGACSSKAMDWAAAENHVDVVRWLQVYRREGCSKAAMNKAAENGHLDMVKWLHRHRKEGCTTDAMDNAAANGHLHVVKWLFANRQERCTDGAMTRAVSNGHLQVVRWLDASGLCEVLPAHLMLATRNSRKAVVQWIVAHKPEIEIDPAVEHAFLYGDFDLVLDFHRSGRISLPLTDGLAKAVAAGHCEILEFLLREYGETVRGLADFACSAALEASPRSYCLDCFNLH